MSKSFWVIIITCLSSPVLWGQHFSQKISGELAEALRRNETPDVLVAFAERADLSAAKGLNTKSGKADFVFKKLVETAQKSQRRALELIHAQGASANGLFLVNALAIEKASPQLLAALAELPEVSTISLDPWIPFEAPTPAEPVARDRNGIEWGLEKVGAPLVWDLGYTGQGITIGGADTGYDWEHPAIQTQYRGWAGNAANTLHDYHWHDAIHELNPLNTDDMGNLGTNPCGLSSSRPCDDHSHGTHTMGTMVGDDAQGNQIGMAPGARWVACRNMERGWGKPSTYIECFQWFLAPTDLGGQNPDPGLAPHVISNSWLCPYEEGCTDLAVNELIRTAVVNLRSSGVVVVFSNGNSGPGCSSASLPGAYFEESFSIGATNSQDWIAGFSSRGPVLVDGSNRMKPNVSAPGVSVRSCVLNGEYAWYSGTSMASPHVAGLVALMLSANPALAGHVDAIEDIIEQTAVFIADTLDCSPNSLGNARPNHAYGWGRIDAVGAVAAALQWQPPVSTQSPSGTGPVVRVAPNPVIDAAVFTVEQVVGQAVLEIWDAAGSLVSTSQWTSDGRENIRADLSGQMPGIYFWRVKSEQGSVSGKLLRR
jgi:subtilisin family serine protease